MGFYPVWVDFIEKVELVDKFMIHNKRKSMNIEFKRLMLQSFKKSSIYKTFVERLIDEILEEVIVQRRLFFNENFDGDNKVMFLEERMDMIKVLQYILKVVQMLIAIGSDDFEAYFKRGLLERLERLFKMEISEVEGQKIKYINYVLHRGMEREYVIKQFMLEKWHDEIASTYKTSILSTFIETFLPSLSYSEQETLFFNAQKEGFANLKKLKGISTFYDDMKTFEKFISGYVTHTGLEIVENSKKSASAEKSTLIRDLVEFKMRLDNMVKVALSDSASTITEAIHDAFEAISSDESNNSELISGAIVNYFIDETAAGTIVSEENKSFLEGVMYILGAAVPEKDVFEVAYRNRLSRELMNRSSKPYDQKKFRETSAVLIDNYLNKSLGASFLKKINGMIEDLKMSDEALQSFSASRTGGIELDMKVLTRSYWPESVRPSSEAMVACTSSLILPKEMSSVLKDFCTFFASREKRNQFMKLDMDCFYGTSAVYIEGRFPSAGTKTLVTSLPEALVLMCFREDGSSATLAEITKRTGIRDRDAKKIIRVFASKNVSILRVKSDSSEQVVEVNDKFESKKALIRIKKKTPNEAPPPTQSPSDQQGDSAEKRELIFKREEHVDCLLMRALKGTQPKTVTEIMTFVEQWSSKQKFFVGFKPDTKYVTERLESLVKMSYVTKEGDTYSYVP